jgi:hypothetical protein
MKIRSDSFPHGGYIPPCYALGRHPIYPKAIEVTTK